MSGMGSRILLAAAIVSLAGSCAGRPEPERSSGRLDLAGRFKVPPRETSDAPPARAESFIPNLPVVRRGLRRESMVLVAPVSVQASLSGFSGSATLEFEAAPVFNLGDGLLLDVLISDGRESRSLLQRYFDPGRRAADREWMRIQIPVEVRDQPAAYLELRITAGPRGDETSDWLAVSEPRLVRPSGDR